MNVASGLEGDRQAVFRPSSRPGHRARARADDDRLRHGNCIESQAGATRPGRFHRDPADRILIALARRLDVPLVTSDRAIRRYRHVRAVW